MADKTGIEWTEATWNPVLGCTHVSAGCDNCYAAREASGRLRGHALYAGLAESGKFTGEVRLVPARLDQPLRWRRPRRIFVNSMADLFHDSVPDEFIARVFAVMAAAPQHSFQLLTKRHARMRSLLRSDQFLDLLQAAAGQVPEHLMGFAYPLRNVWLGVSVENQQWADIRIPALLDTPAAVRWISAEPLLGPIRLLDDDHRGHEREWHGSFYACLECSTEDQIVEYHEQNIGLDWVVAGGESGPNARPMHPDWARQLRDQCQAAGVPYLFKQAGEVLAREWGCKSKKGGDASEWPEAFPREYPG